MEHAAGGEASARNPTDRAKTMTEPDSEQVPPSSPGLTALRTAYLRDRAARDVAHPPITVPHRCRYCQKTWQRFGGTQFDGHVICSVSAEFMNRIVGILDAGISYAAIATQLGVNANVVRAWWMFVKRSS